MRHLIVTCNMVRKTKLNKKKKIKVIHTLEKNISKNTFKKKDNAHKVSKTQLLVVNK